MFDQDDDEAEFKEPFTVEQETKRLNSPLEKTGELHTEYWSHEHAPLAWALGTDEEGRISFLRQEDNGYPTLLIGRKNKQQK